MKKYLFLVLFLLLSACGFSPLYVQREKSGGWYFDGKFDTTISDEMRQVKVEPIANRFGQLLRNNLLDNLTPTGVPKNPKYRLFVKLKNKTISLQALREDISATPEMAIYRVGYSMKQGDKVLFNNESIAYVSYDILNNPYSTTMAQKKAEKEAAKIISDDIALRVGAYFHMLNSKIEESGALQTGAN